MEVAAELSAGSWCEAQHKQGDESASENINTADSGSEQRIVF